MLKNTKVIFRRQVAETKLERSVPALRFHLGRQKSKHSAKTHGQKQPDFPIKLTSSSTPIIFNPRLAF